MVKIHWHKVEVWKEVWIVLKDKLVDAVHKFSNVLLVPERRSEQDLPRLTPALEIQCARSHHLEHDAHIVLRRLGIVQHVSALLLVDARDAVSEGRVNALLSFWKRRGRRLTVNYSVISTPWAPQA